MKIRNSLTENIFSDKNFLLFITCFVCILGEGEISKFRDFLLCPFCMYGRCWLLMFCDCCCCEGVCYDCFNCF